MSPSSATGRRDPRLVGYVVAGLVLTAIALVAGRPWFLAAAAPFCVAVIVGVRGPLGLVAPIAHSTVSAPSVFEQESLRWQLVIERAPGTEIDLVVHVDEWLSESPIATGALPVGDGPIGFEVELQARLWGRHEPGHVEVRMRRPLGLIEWHTAQRLGPTITVLPQPHRLRTMLDPETRRAVPGAHLSTMIGEGTDFAEIRPAIASDQLRRVNWAATARTGEIHVNRRLAERSGEVVICLDTATDQFNGRSRANREMQARAGRLAWSLAVMHFQCQDRVGLLVRGSSLRTLHPAAGHHAQYRLLQAVLDSAAALPGGRWSDGHRPEHDSDHARLRAGATVVVLSPLWQTTMVRRIIDLSRYHPRLTVVCLNSDGVLPPPVDQAERIAQQMFALTRLGHLDMLRRRGITVIEDQADTPPDATIRQLNQLQRSLRTVHR